MNEAALVITRVDDHSGLNRGEHGKWIDLHGDHINLFIEEGPALGPVLEVTVDDVKEAKRRLVARGCEIVKDEPDFPRCYIKDPFGLIFNLTASALAARSS